MKKGMQVLGAMGEGGEEMGKAMLNDMPLSALAGFAGLSEEQVQGIVAALNSEE